MFPPPTQVVPGPNSNSSHVLDIIDKVTKIAAVLLGAAWTALTYFRGRTFKRRLELKILGKTFRTHHGLFLSGLAQIKNVGLSKVTIQQEGTAIQVFSQSSDDDAGGSSQITEQSCAVLAVFEKHRWIEPGELIEDSFLLPIPSQDSLVALRLRLRIVAGGNEWNAYSIVELVTPDSAQSAGAYTAKENSPQTQLPPKRDTTSLKPELLRPDS